MKDTGTQSERILAYLQSGRTLTSLEALQLFGCFRLASRINDLKSSGHKIKVAMHHDLSTGKRYARYSLDVFQFNNQGQGVLT